MRTERIRLWIGFAIISFVWGSTWLAIKIGLHSVPPLTAAGMRFFLAGCILWVIMKLRRIEVPVTPQLKRLYLFLILFSYSIPFAIVYWSQQHIPSGLGSILFSVFPFWVAVFSHLMLVSERLNGYKLAGIGLGIVGLVIIFFEDVHVSDPMGLLGMLGIVFTTIMQGLALVLIKKHAQPVSPLALNFVGMTAGGALLLLAAFGFESMATIQWDESAIGSILYLSIIGSVVTFVVYYWLLKRVEAVYLSLVSFINPIVAVVLGSVVLGETLAASVFVGAAFVLVGIVIANGKQLLTKLTA